MKIEINNLVKHFGEKEVLRDVSFSVENGQAIGLLGRNGAGKTTSIRIVMGVFYPDSGNVLVDGKPINRDKISIGYLPEERGLYPKQKIADQLAYFGRLRGLSRADAREKTKRWLERMDMSQYADKKLETLSKGNQQKIQLATTLLCDPQLVILDEPFSGLDPVNAMLLKDVIKEMIEKGSAVIFSSHQMNYVEEFCENVAILNCGKIAVGGRINDIKRSYPRDNILINSPDFEKLSSFLIKDLNDIVVSSDFDEKQQAVHIQLKDPENKHKIIAAVSQKGFDIDRFEVCEPTLNDIFVQYTEGGV